MSNAQGNATMAVTKTELAVIEGFVARVCERAEANMLKTGRLEGAHYAAMTAILEELRAAL